MFGKDIHNYWQVDTQTDKHGGEVVGQVLKDHNVKFVFCLSGGHISPILVAAEKQNIRVVDVRDEVTVLQYDCGTFIVVTFSKRASL